jgi:hypothetical protein
MKKGRVKASGIVAGIIVLLVLGSCKKAEDVSEEIQYTLDIVDHVTGGGKSMSKTGYANSSMVVTTSEAEISGVVAGYISVQDPYTGKILGSGSNGTVTFTTTTSMDYRVIRFHDGEGFKELYDALVAAGITLYAGRGSLWGRKDDTGITGAESIWTGSGHVFDQVESALRLPFWLGGLMTGGHENWYGFNTHGDSGKDVGQRWIYVNPQDRSDVEQVRAGLEELIEYLGAFNDILGETTQMTLCDPGSDVLSEKGLACLRFIFAYCQ